MQDSELVQDKAIVPVAEISYPCDNLGPPISRGGRHRESSRVSCRSTCTKTTLLVEQPTFLLLRVQRTTRKTCTAPLCCPAVEDKAADQPNTSEQHKSSLVGVCVVGNLYSKKNKTSLAAGVPGTFC